MLCANGSSSWSIRIEDERPSKNYLREVPSCPARKIDVDGGIRPGQPQIVRPARKRPSPANRKGRRLTRTVVPERRTDYRALYDEKFTERLVVEYQILLRDRHLRP